MQNALGKKWQTQKGPIDTFKSIKAVNYPITPDEVKYAKKKLKCNKIAAPDGLISEIIKYSDSNFDNHFA